MGVEEDEDKEKAKEEIEAWRWSRDGDNDSTVTMQSISFNNGSDCDNKANVVSDSNGVYHDTNCWKGLYISFTFGVQLGWRKHETKKEEIRIAENKYPERRGDFEPRGKRD